MRPDERIQRNAEAFVATLKKHSAQSRALHFTEWPNASGVRWLCVETTGQPSRQNPKYSQMFASETARLSDFETAVRALLDAPHEPKCPTNTHR